MSDKKTTKDEFMKKHYITCKYCNYNNEKGRFLKYGKCLNCGKVLDDKIYFLININKRLKDYERKSK